jgi:hypothetical protein
MDLSMVIYAETIPSDILAHTKSTLSILVASSLGGLQANAYQLGQLLSKMLPEVSRFIENPLAPVGSDTKDDSTGRYYAEAIQLHEQYSSQGTDQLAQETAQAYFKVSPFKTRINI